MSKVKKIAINTGGGDAPGLNAVIRSITISALKLGWEVYGIRQGYAGLLDMPPDEGLMPLTRDAVRGITHLGGTILGTSNKSNPFDYVVEEDGCFVEKDFSMKVVERFNEEKFDALFAIGGDGSLGIANRFARLGMPVIGIPKTIDNDIESTITFGFDSAVTTATDALDKLHTTAASHQRVMVVEMMGRYAGWIALHAGVAGSADVILIPEIPYNINKVCEKIMEREAAGRHFDIVVVSEGARTEGGDYTVVGEKEAGREIKLGGVAEQVAAAIQKKTGKEARSLVLGHLQRGGGPTTFDRLISLQFGAAAVRALDNGVVNVMVAINPPEVCLIPLDEAVKNMKTVPMDSDIILTARSLGISLGQ